MYDHGGHLGQVIWTIYVKFHFTYQSKGGSTNFALIGQVVSSKILEINVNIRVNGPEQGQQFPWSRAHRRLNLTFSLNRYQCQSRIIDTHKTNEKEILLLLTVW